MPDDLGTGSAPSPLVLIVLLNWNNSEDTLAALASLRDTTYRHWRALVVDNGSAAEALATLRAGLPPDAELLTLPENTGYTGGCNLGLKRGAELGADYVWLLNNDAVVPPETLASLVNVANHDPSPGIVSPLLADLDNPDKITIAGALFDRQTREHSDTHKLTTAQAWQRERPGGFVVYGTAMLISTRVIRAIGLLDDSFFAYYEDVDYCLRALDAGFRVAVDWNSRVLHANKNMYGRPEEIKPHYWYFMARNEQRLWRKTLGWRRSLRVNWWITARFLKSWKLAPLSFAAREALLAGLWHGWLGRNGAWSPAIRAPRLFQLAATRYSRRFRP